jgi:hypothetical protein
MGRRAEKPDHAHHTFSRRFLNPRRRDRPKSTFRQIQSLSKTRTRHDVPWQPPGAIAKATPAATPTSVLPVTQPGSTAAVGLDYRSTRSWATEPTSRMPKFEGPSTPRSDTDLVSSGRTHKPVAPNGHQERTSVSSGQPEHDLLALSTTLRRNSYWVWTSRSVSSRATSVISSLLDGPPPEGGSALSTVSTNLPPRPRPRSRPARALRVQHAPPARWLGCP